MQGKSEMIDQYDDVQRDLDEEKRIALQKEHTAMVLERITETAIAMMDGAKFRSRSGKLLVEYGLWQSCYHEDGRCEAIELSLANGGFDEVCKAVADLKGLMFEYCRDQAAAYLGFDLEELERGE